MHPIALSATLAAVMVPVMSFFGVNVALGQIGSELGASAGMLQLVVAAYGVVYASLVVIGGQLGDSHGRKRLLVLGLVGFSITSLLCAAAQSPGQLVGARFLQGITAALIAPQVLATIHASTDGHHRDRAIGRGGHAERRTGDRADVDQRAGARTGHASSVRDRAQSGARPPRRAG